MFELTNQEKKQWIFDAIREAQLKLITSEYEPQEYVTFNCPWNARYRVGNDHDHLEVFRKKIEKCPGYKNPVKPRKRKYSPPRTISIEQFTKRYGTEGIEYVAS